MAWQTRWVDADPVTIGRTAGSWAPAGGAKACLFRAWMGHEKGCRARRPGTFGGSGSVLRARRECRPDRNMFTPRKAKVVTTRPTRATMPQTSGRAGPSSGAGAARRRSSATRSGPRSFRVPAPVTAPGFAAQSAPRMVAMVKNGETDGDGLVHQVVQHFEGAGLSGELHPNAAKAISTNTTNKANHPSPPWH